MEVGDYVTCGAAPVRHLPFNGFRLPGGLTADSICPVRRAASRPAKEPAAVSFRLRRGRGATGWARPSEGALRRRLSTLTPICGLKTRRDYKLLRLRPTRCFACKPTPQTPSTTPLEVACPDVLFSRRPDSGIPTWTVHSASSACESPDRGVSHPGLRRRMDGGPGRSPVRGCW